MTTFEAAVAALVDTVEHGEKPSAWQAAIRITSLLSNTAVLVRPDILMRAVKKCCFERRWFDIAEIVAAAATARVDASSAMRRLHAQMLLERGLTEEALVRLDTLLATRQLSPADRTQAFGHIGRIFKDRFIDRAQAGDAAGAQVLLGQSLNLGYLAGLKEDPGNVWLAVNAVALLSRPEARATHPNASQMIDELVQAIRAGRSTSEENRRYEEASLAETYLATGDLSEAGRLVKAYLAKPEVNVFALNNLRRQLADVWQLGEHPFPGPELLAMVSTAILGKDGGVVKLTSTDVESAHSLDYQAVFGADRFDSFQNYCRGIERCACVARIGRTSETGVGTGFLLPGRELSPQLSDAFVLITNAHVISEAESDRNAGALHPQEAVVTFAAMPGVDATREFGVARVLCVSPRGALDMVVAELTVPVTPTVPYPVAPVLPVAGSRAAVRVIGHPSGRGLSLSSNVLLDHQSPKLHYSTATEGGSSGSPVFNQDWKLIGLHHAGGEAVPRLNGHDGTYAANEGMWIGALREAVSLQLR